MLQIINNRSTLRFSRIKWMDDGWLCVEGICNFTHWRSQRFDMEKVACCDLSFIWSTLLFAAQFHAARPEQRVIARASMFSDFLMKLRSVETAVFSRILSSWNLGLCCRINWNGSGWTPNAISVIQSLADGEDGAADRFIQRQSRLIGFVLPLEKQEVFYKVSACRASLHVDLADTKAADILHHHHVKSFAYQNI